MRFPVVAPADALRTAVALYPRIESIEAVGLVHDIGIGSTVCAQKHRIRGHSNIVGNACSRLEAAFRNIHDNLLKISAFEVAVYGQCLAGILRIHIDNKFRGLAPEVNRRGRLDVNHGAHRVDFRETGGEQVIFRVLEGKCRSVFACELDGIAGYRQIGRDIDLHERDHR